jgi:hypothetical protein
MIVSAPKWAVLNCPCQRGHRVILDLHPKHSPRWRVIVMRDGFPTIRPSIDVHEKIRCHYVVTGGRVWWVPEDDRR